MPAMPPSVYALVMEQNLRQVEQLHLLDRAYFKCVRMTHPPVMWRALCGVNLFIG